MTVHDPEYRRSFKDWESFVSTLTERITEADETIPEEMPVDADWGDVFDDHAPSSSSASGDDDGLQDYQHVFGWIYRMGKPFLARLRARDPPALVMIAYYAVLFQTMDFLWFLDGWKEHLLTRVRGLLPEEYTSWLEWPIKMTGVVI